MKNKIKIINFKKKIINFKIIILVLFIFMLIFSSCESEDNNDKINNFDEDIISGKNNEEILFDKIIFPSQIGGVNCIGPSFSGTWGALESEEINEGYDTIEKDLPFGLIHIGFEWGLMFNEDGSYDWTEIDLHMKRIKNMDRRASIVVSALESWPEDYDDDDALGKEFTLHYINFSQSLLNRYPNLIDYYWVDNEVNLALNNMDIESKDYLKFYDEVKLELSKSHPEIKIGIVVTYPYESDTNALAEGEDKIYDLIEFATEDSLIGMTFYPQFLDMQAKVAAGKLSMVDDLFEGKNVSYGVIETGWSSKGYGSNPEEQGDFYKNLVLESYKDNSTNRKFLCIWGLYNPKLSGIQEAFFLISPGLSKWVKNLGFFENDGSEKPAWYLFRSSLYEVLNP